MAQRVDNSTSFGLHPAEYRRYRPRYPAALFDFLARSCARRAAALDCATGNGQAAAALAERFAYVLAIDPSAAQIAHATRRPNVEYRVAAAEQLPATNVRFDLITIAQGAHWLDLPAFYGQARPLAAAACTIAIWGYSHCRVTPAIDAIVQRVLLDAVEPYWAEGNRVLVDKYRSIEFPFDEIDAPDFEIAEQWDRETLYGYVRTWSAYKRCVAESGRDPLVALTRMLDAHDLWPSGAILPVRFEMPLRVGRFE